MKKTTDTTRHFSPLEFEGAKRLENYQDYPHFEEEQLKDIRLQVQRYRKWANEHTTLHNLINFASTIFLLGMLAVALTSLPDFLITLNYSRLIVLFPVGLLHGYLLYTLLNYTLHEGSAHDMIFLGKHPVIRFFNSLANNIPRINWADPIFYKENHHFHHSKFASEEDGAFSNFVTSKKFYGTLIPLAGLFNMTTYKIHSGMAYTKSRIASAMISIIVLLGSIYILSSSLGIMYAAISLGIVSPTFGFTLDRMRETSEHNMMPMDKTRGSRNLGLGFWGLLIGGGPWGQPCHLSHHLGPSLSWYHQVLLHLDLKKILNEEQKEVYLVKEDFLTYPKLFARNLKLSVQIERDILKLTDNIGAD